MHYKKIFVNQSQLDILPVGVDRFLFITLNIGFRFLFE